MALYSDWIGSRTLPASAPMRVTVLAISVILESSSVRAKASPLRATSLFNSNPATD